jgi:hypothetical protein
VSQIRVMWLCHGSFNDTLLVVMNYEGGKTWEAYLVVHCSASSPHYTAVPERKHDARLRVSMVAGYWLQIVLFFSGCVHSEKDYHN